MKNNKKVLLLIFITAFIFVGGFVYPDQDVRAETESELLKDKSKLEKKLKETEAELQSLNSQYYKNQAQINATMALVKKLQDDILRREAEMDNLNARAKLNKEMLGEYIRKLYYADQENNAIKLAASNGSLSDLAADPDGMVEIKEKIMETLQAIEISKGETEEAKSELAEKKEDHQETIQEKKTEQGAVVADINETQATIGELQKKLVELQRDLLAVTGKSYSAKNIQDAVEFASGRTGVPKGVLYGFLKMETNLGANTGQCTYAQVEKVSVARYKKYGSKYKASIALLYKRKELFYDIVKSLDYSKDKKVSCSPSYIGQGGAMGVSQFMSDTWNGYSAQISAQTGHGKPDPWDLTDGVMGLALKLKKAGATSDSASAIKKASINYLGAFNNNYYSGIVYWAKNYKTLFK